MARRNDWLVDLWPKRRGRRRERGLLGGGMLDQSRGRRAQQPLWAVDFLKTGRRRKRRRPGMFESLLRAWFRSKPDDTGTEATIRARHQDQSRD